LDFLRPAAAWMAIESSCADVDLYGIAFGLAIVSMSAAVFPKITLERNGPAL